MTATSRRGIPIDETLLRSRGFMYALEDVAGPGYDGLEIWEGWLNNQTCLVRLVREVHQPSGEREDHPDCTYFDYDDVAWVLGCDEDEVERRCLEGLMPGCAPLDHQEGPRIAFEVVLDLAYHFDGGGTWADWDRQHLDGDLPRSVEGYEDMLRRIVEFLDREAGE